MNMAWHSFWVTSNICIREEIKKKKQYFLVASTALSGDMALLGKHDSNCENQIACTCRLDMAWAELPTDLQLCTVLPKTIGTDVKPDPEVIKLFSCSTQLSMKFVLLINLQLLTIANSFLLNIAEHGNFSANKYENANYCWHFHIN